MSNQRKATPEEQVLIDLAVQQISAVARRVKMASNHWLAIFVSLTAQTAVQTGRSYEDLLEQLKMEYDAMVAQVRQ